MKYCFVAEYCWYKTESNCWPQLWAAGTLS